MARKVSRSTLTIPEQYLEGFKKLVRLSREDSQSLANALEQAKSVSVADLTSLASKSLSSLALTDAKEIIQTILSLYFALASADMSVGTFVGELAHAAIQAQVPDLSSPDLVESLTSILSVKSLSMISKARGLHIDHENTFCSIRILTDMRPVFDQDVRQDPVGFVIAHILKLGFHHYGKHQVIYVAMDKIDIDTMIGVLQRAKDKATTISSFIKDKDGFTILAD